MFRSLRSFPVNREADNLLTPIHTSSLNDIQPRETIRPSVPSHMNPFAKCRSLGDAGNIIRSAVVSLSAVGLSKEVDQHAQMLEDKYKESVHN